MKIIITGTRGFIGGHVAGVLKADGHQLIIADWQITEDKFDGMKMILPEELLRALNEDPAPSWAVDFRDDFDAIIHLGANTNTQCEDKELLRQRNSDYTKALWEACTRRRKRFIFASSAATYGDGSQGFEDDTAKLHLLKPLNLYAESKHVVDVWAVEQAKAGKAPPQWASLKFFNVYGPSEWHKGNMASMVFRTCQQIQNFDRVKLFKDGEQKRDWVWVGDVASVIKHMLNHPCYSIYNVGSGQARSFNEVADIAFRAFGKEKRIEYMDMPEKLKAAYQSYSLADLSKLKMSYTKPMTSLEDGIKMIEKDWGRKPA